MPAPTPPVFTTAFAADAGPSFIENPIPETTVDPGRASLEQGFPPLTMEPVLSGGVPPFGQDVNGILFMLSSHTVYQQTGQPYFYNSAISAALTGYAKGTLLGMADGTGVWINQTDGNTTDPDSLSAAGWQPLYAYGYTSVTALTGGVVVLTPAQASKSVIVLSGALTSNLQVVLPNSLRTWLIVNLCTGAFTTTVKTASGTGVTVQASGYPAPTGVYGDGTNIYPNSTPLPVAISIAPDPSTIVERDANGYVYAAYFNTNAVLQNYTMDAVVSTQGGDGFLRRISPANFQAQLALQNFAGAVTAAQVPLAAVYQYASQLWASPTLSGSPVAPTPPVGDSDSSIATTAFANPGQSQAQSGWVQLPGGLIIQWGKSTGAAGPGTMTINFPRAFTTAVYAAVASTADRTAASSNGYGSVSSLTLNTMVVNADTSAITGNRAAFWFVIGV